MAIDQPFKQWPTIVFPAWLQVLGFEDASWKNDSCARAVKYLTEAARESQVPVLECWLEHERGEDREDPESPRFGVLVYSTKPCGDGPPDEVAYSGEDAAEFLSAITSWLEKNSYARK